ncbi:uncharacterized protein A4U43_C04F31690 [Asparagus officinalis]|uniref:Mannosyltransferase n=2 Tax=Asparagus officinalis TaxID=4686 RepID=A0A5P1F7T5_ASPOF|nr:dol-P-Man:Man(7)GlcNAc(2)-PP-Dol alpha-1,6-mannosyltransferase-like isoform X2 [Asparagus officinalis]XP_020263086.1 dol-P-Man:Man(7)GlcNAc(2)-PP-Dol alpha-1,6-mannosyltransferase-like isoform X2 [Asparagus officinalis]ONK73457.1 uncharacterized protein A4U43_C04F31690 [Asparagus officinalis]
MHDILYHRYHIEKYDHLDFPGVVSRTFLGAIFVSTLASPMVLLLHLLHMPKIYSLITVRLVLGCTVLLAFRLLRVQVRNKFGRHVEAFFVITAALQFHLLFYSTRPLPNILAFALVTLAYSFWFKGNSSATLKCLVCLCFFDMFMCLMCDIFMLLLHVHVLMLFLWEDGLIDQTISNRTRTGQWE